MIVYGREFFKMKFTADSMKKAYMNACKWYATNVLSKDELHDVQVVFEKNYDEQFPTVTIRLFASLDGKELNERHCEICRETSNLFYMHTNDNCNRCASNAYQRRAESMIKNKIEYYKEIIHKRV